jgi:hypothetical protein
MRRILLQQQLVAALVQAVIDLAAIGANSAWFPGWC